MKEFLTAHERPFRKTHDLDELGRACEEINIGLKEKLAEVRDLTVFAWEFRYPGDSQVPSLSEARQSLTLAHTAFEDLLSPFPDNLRP